MSGNNHHTNEQLTFVETLKYLTAQFWLLNILQMLEKLAYWSVLMQMSVYIAQKDVVSGLNWDQSLKGIIFFFWALVHNLTPFFLGWMPDKYGRKKLLLISLIIILTSYLLLGTQTSFVPFLVGILLLGFGSGLFKPALQGAIGSTLNSRTSPTGWGIYFMLLNLALIAAPPLSKYLKEISPAMIFFGSATIMLLNILATLFIKPIKRDNLTPNWANSIIFSLKSFSKPRIYIFILAMSGFAVIYMQFYETFQNFIIDWPDTSAIVKSLGLAKFIITDTGRGVMISYEWLYTINSILITLFIVAVSRLTGKISQIKAIILGVILATAGITTAGTSLNGAFLIAGFIIYTFGEMIVNPKFTGFLSSIAPKKEKSMYLGYLNLSMAIGLGIGSLLGGYLYENFGEKSSLALKFLQGQGVNIENISPTIAFSTLATKLNLTQAQATQLLWDTYHPWIIWMPFIAIAIISIIVLFIYLKKYPD